MRRVVKSPASSTVWMRRNRLGDDHLLLAMHGRRPLIVHFLFGVSVKIVTSQETLPSARAREGGRQT